MQFLIDTDLIILSVLGKRRFPDQLLDKIGGQRLAISAITLCELYEGAFHSVNPDASIDSIRQALDPFGMLPLSDEICLRFGKLRAQLRRAGQMTGDLDLLIASTALEHDLTLLTRNVRDFANVPGLRMASV